MTWEIFLSALQMSVVLTALIWASYTDVTQFKVRNALTIPLFFGGLAFFAATNGWEGFLMSLRGAGIGFLILVIPYLMGGLGAGDVKFVMAVGTWIGLDILPAIIVGCLAIIVYYIAIIKKRNSSSIGLVDGIQLVLLRLANFGRNLIVPDHFEPVQSVSNSSSSIHQSRLIPFSAMMSVGIVLVFILSRFFGS